MGANSISNDFYAKSTQDLINAARAIDDAGIVSAVFNGADINFRVNGGYHLQHIMAANGDVNSYSAICLFRDDGYETYMRQRYFSHVPDESWAATWDKWMVAVQAMEPLVVSDEGHYPTALCPMNAMRNPDANIRHSIEANVQRSFLVTVGSYDGQRAEDRGQDIMKLLNPENPFPNAYTSMKFDF